MSKKINALKLDEKDNVVVALEMLKAGELVSVRNETKKINVTKTIHYGHKVAIAPIPIGKKVIKYGECMGIATKDIATGDHVHVSNVRGLTEEDKIFQKEVINVENI
ncbi:UxaA family hydrolase [Aquibacillus sp. 3ASR75-11]|uniref:UxaA family hydrolase n=1 Tax=Terrihalobacillus insolitus TaxID=2950438 RepID=A0A9X4AL18_9BACI|nr:UxaA family hydrolase [Terrihalobacillus insolitus]MDC3423414.1 UxaA family hydrolase [Terrihalobacillus insolitus]